MNGKKYFYQFYENLVNQFCSIVLPVLYLIQAHFKCTFQSAWVKMSALASWLTHAALPIFIIIFLQKNNNFFNDKKKIGRNTLQTLLLNKRFYITNAPAT
jgi:hypothetical protein